MSYEHEHEPSGRTFDPSQPLAGELPPGRAALFVRLGLAVFLVGLGAVLGVWLTPETPRESQKKTAELEEKLRAAQARTAELERALAYRAIDTPGQQGRLKPADRQRHEKIGRRYAHLLRQTKAQGAADLVMWFVDRWDGLLDRPQPDDRTGRRAALLALLVGGMAENLNPGDYVPWQAEFLTGSWLGELHVDLDGDGLPGPRSRPNTKDGFADVSVCHVAMALNQSVTDARVLMMPEMRCDRPESRLSIFLQGRTFDDALTEFVRGMRERGFIVVERLEKGTRLILVGARPAAPAP